jgi:hypothetical protein
LSASQTNTEFVHTALFLAIIASIASKDWKILRKKSLKKERNLNSYKDRNEN